MRLRPADSADAPAVAAIYAHYVATSAATFDEETPVGDDVAARIAETHAAGLPFLVADVGGEVGGYAYLAPWSRRSAYRYTVEDSVYVAPAARRRGIGHALLDRLLHDGAAAGMRQVIAVITVAPDPASVLLHRRQGFREVGRLQAVGLKFGSWHDVVLMQRSLR